MKKILADHAIAESDATILRYMQQVSMKLQQHADGLVAKSYKELMYMTKVHWTKY